MASFMLNSARLLFMVFLFPLIKAFHWILAKRLQKNMRSSRDWNVMIILYHVLPVLKMQMNQSVIIMLILIERILQLWLVILLQKDLKRQFNIKQSLILLLVVSVKEKNQHDISRPTTCRKHSFQDSPGFTSGTVGFSHKSDQSEPPSSNDFNVINSTPKLKAPCACFQSGNSLFGCGYSKDSGENVNCQPQEEPVAERNMGHVESLLVGRMGASSADGHKFAALDSASVLPGNEHNKSSLTGTNW